MHKTLIRLTTAVLISVALVAAEVGVAHSQQIADPNFDASVTRPAYINEHPKVLSQVCRTSRPSLYLSNPTSYSLVAFLENALAAPQRKLLLTRLSV